MGLLVDGPIVITEYARAEQEKGIRRSVSYLNAAHDMFYPIFASTLTTVLAFLPLAILARFFWCVDTSNTKNCNSGFIMLASCYNDYNSCTWVI